VVPESLSPVVGQESPSPVVGQESPSLVVGLESPSAVVGPKSPLPTVGAPVFTNDVPPKSLASDGMDPLSVLVIGESFGTTVDGSRSGGNALGLDSSLEAALLSKNLSV
jgi:hypothetical protein